MGSIKKNFLYNSLYQILILILPLVTVPYISRVMGPSGVGIYSYTFAIASYLYLIAMLGVNNYGNRTIAMVRDDRKKLTESFWSIYYLQLILSLLLSLGYIFFVIEYVDEYKLIYLLQVLYIISAAFDINWFCFGLEEFKLTVTRNTIIKILSVIAIFLFVNSSDDLWLYTLIMTAGLLLSQVVIWPFVIKRIDFLIPSWYSIRKHIKPNLVLFIPVIAISLYKVMDKIMLGAMSDVAQVGFYTNALKIVSIPLGLLTALGTVMLPRMSNLVANGELLKSKEMISKSMYFVMFMAAAFGFGIAGIAPEFTPWFFGDEFVDSTPLIMGLSITIVFIGWANVIRTQYLIPNSKDNIYIISVICGAVINLIINIIFIPVYGAMGAVVGTVVAEATVCIIQTWMARNALDIKKYFKDGLVFLMFGAIMFLALRGIPLLLSGTIIIVVQVLIGILLYVSLSMIFLIKIKKDYELINNIFKMLRLKKRFYKI